MPTPNTFTIDATKIEAIGKIVDDLEFTAALNALPGVSSSLKVEQMSRDAKTAASALKSIVIETTGSDPWADDEEPEFEEDPNNTFRDADFAGFAENH